MSDQVHKRSVVAKFHRDIFRFFLNKSCNASEDLTQETFLRYFEQVKKGKEIKNERGYLFRSAHSVLIDHYRRSAGRPVLESAESVADLSPSLSSIVSQHRRSALLARCLRKIPISLQLTLELHYWDGLTVVEISDVLSIPDGTVKTHLQEGRRKLLTLLTRSIGSGEEAFSLIDEDDISRWLAEARKQIFNSSVG